ncbi:MAG TPA: hypothetical protein V6D20_02925, partial [Candidatus Obscuribacterales bacterium]
KYSANVDNINLNPASNLTLQVVTGRQALSSLGLYSEMSRAFPDEHFHIGGDEGRHSFCQSTTF